MIRFFLLAALFSQFLFAGTLTAQTIAPRVVVSFTFHVKQNLNGSARPGAYRSIFDYHPQILLNGRLVRFTPDKIRIDEDTNSVLFKFYIKPGKHKLDVVNITKQGVNRSITYGLLNGPTTEKIQAKPGETIYLPYKVKKYPQVRVEGHPANRRNTGMSLKGNGAEHYFSERIFQLQPGSYTLVLHKYAQTRPCFVVGGFPRGIRHIDVPQLSCKPNEAIRIKMIPREGGGSKILYEKVEIAKAKQPILKVNLNGVIMILENGSKIDLKLGDTLTVLL